MEKVIVFGGSGFIGSAVVEVLLKHGIEVCAVVKPGFYESPERFRLDGLDVHIIECDLRDVTRLKSLLPWSCADVFYQLAWEGLVGDAITDYATQLSNVRWLLDSIVLAAELGCKKIIGAGTISQDELQTDDGRRHQSDRHRIFRTAALACEYMGESVAAEYGIDFIWPIISNVYGEGELNPRLITTLIRKMLLDEAMPLSSGNQNYDFIYRTDAGEALYRLGEFGKAHCRYNIASGNVHALREYLTQARDAVAPNYELQLGVRPDSGVHLDPKSFDITTLKEDTGFYPQVSFVQGINKTSSWLSRTIL